MAGKRFTWSYSALSAFETCPRQYFETRVKKAWESPPGEVQLWGQQVHKLIEKRLTMGNPLPDYLKYVEPIVAQFERAGPYVQAEYKLALNEQFEPVEFFAQDVWVRAVGDVIIMNGRAALACDWKAGKYREGTDQLSLQAAIMLATYPKLERVSNVYVWLRDRRTTRLVVTRDECPAIWQEFLPRVKRMQLAFENQDFPPKPSGLCKKFCPVKTCEFWGKGAY